MSLPPIPSEITPPKRLGLFDMSILVSIVLFAIGISLLLNKSYVIKSQQKSKMTNNYIIYIGFIFCHLILRFCFWLLENSAFFGKPLYNILVHSIVYSMMMFFVFMMIKIIKERDLKTLCVGEGNGAE